MLSAVAHVGLLGLVLAAPEGRRMTRPTAISVDLVALAPGGAPKPRPAPPKPAPAAEAAPKPEPAPPPPPKPKEVVLPEKPRGPRPDPKPEPRRREVFIEPKPAEQEKSLDDLLSEMREDAGEPAAAAESAEPVETAVADTEGPPGGGGGVLVSAEVRDWMLRAKRHVRRAWVVPPGFRNEPLETHVLITLDARGNVIGTPEIERRSGNPWFDDGVVRGIAKASPLPAPPEPGEWAFIFTPEDSL